MCGIVALWSREAPLSECALDGALDVLRQRGPDGRGSVLVDHGRLALGHTRLAVIAPAQGAQPIGNEDGSIMAVVNGEFYDFARARRALEQRGHRFSTESDSELLVHLYEEHGLDCLHALRGEFAFVLWDARTRRLLAGRDRFGIKPLVYAQDARGWMLASEAKALFALGLSRAWDQQSFAHALVHQYLPPDRTLFEGVRQLPPGCLLISERGQAPRVERYWDLDFHRREQEVSDAEACTRVREALEQAVRLRLRADVPVAFHLSGGLDSASILALASRQLSTRAQAFTLGFEHAPYGEAAQARAVASALGAELQVVEASQEALVEVLADAVYFGEGLCINAQLPAKLLLARAIRDRGFKVVLSGEGADEALLGYAHLAHDLDPGAPADPAQLGVMLPQGEGPELAAVRDALGFVPTFMQAKAGFGERLLGLLRDDVPPEGLRSGAYTRLLAGIDVHGQLHGRPPVLQSTYLWTRLTLAGYILRTLGDGTEMAASVEGRTPFLDHVFFEEARALPIASKIRGHVQKHVLREAMRGLLPDEVLARRKHPFLAPPLSRFGSPNTRAYLLDVLHGAALTRLPWLDAAKVRDFGVRALTGNAGAEDDPALMTVISACLLQQRFGLQEGTP